MQFMVDCAVVLNHCMALGVSQRNLRVQKYRGSAFDENESPFVIGPGGFDVAITRKLGRVDAIVTTERIGSGVTGSTPCSAVATTAAPPCSSPASPAPRRRR